MNPTANTNKAKDLLRQKVWDRLEAENIGRTGPVHGEIPNFSDADQAARLLTEHPAWDTAKVVKANPDKTQSEVRLNAVNASKLLYMAVPRIATAAPFHLIDPSDLHIPTKLAVSGRGAAEHMPRTSPNRMRTVDVIICGSVAVNPQGVRIGKGAGYSDIEMSLLAQAGLITEHTLIVTTVHPLQVIDAEIPEAAHDVSIDLIVTPEEVITCPPRRRPSGIDWKSLPEDKIKAIPLLQALQSSSNQP